MSELKILPVSCKSITAQAVDGGRIILSLKELKIDLTGLKGYELVEGVMGTDKACIEVEDTVNDSILSLPKEVTKAKIPFADLRYYAAFFSPGLVTLNDQKIEETQVLDFLSSDHRSNLLSPRSVSIVILSGDNVKYLEKCLDSIEKNTEEAYEVLIWSNAKEAETITFLKNISRYRFNSIVHVMPSGEQFNFAIFNNEAAKFSDADYLLFLNDDTEVHPGWLSEMKKRLFLDSKVGIVGSKLLSPDGRLQHMGMALKHPGKNYATHPFWGSKSDIWEASMDRDIGAVTGACMMMRRKDFVNIEGFCEDYEGGFFEDADLCMKIVESGKKVIYCADSVVTHALGSSFGKTTEGYLKANEIKFRGKWDTKIENNVHRFSGRRAIYHSESALILDSFLDTAGGGERTICELAKLLAERYKVSIATNIQFDEDKTRERLKYLLGYDLWGIDIVNFKEAERERDWDIFINGEWGSMKRGIGRRQNLFFTMFPHTCVDYEFLNSYDIIVANSEFTQDYVHKLWKRDSEIVYPPVDIGSIVQKEQSKKENIILSVGRFFPAPGSKKQEVLIKAFWKLNIPKDWEFHLVGSCNKARRQDVEYIKNLQEMADKNKNVFLHVNASAKELSDLYGKAKIFWAATGYGESNPATAEHFGISVVEALSNGLYPIVYDFGGQAEIVKKVREGMVWEDLAGLIRQTEENISDSKLEGKFIAVRDVCNDLFGIARFRKQVLTLLEG